MKKSNKKLIKKMRELTNEGINFYYVPKDIATSEGPMGISIHEGIDWNELEKSLERAEEKLRTKYTNLNCLDVLEKKGK